MFTTKPRTLEDLTTDSVFMLPGYLEMAGLRIGAKGSLKRQVMPDYLAPAPTVEGGCRWWSLGGDTS